MLNRNPRHLLNSNRIFRLEPSIRADIGAVMRRERKSKEAWGRCLYFSLLIAGSQLVQMLQPKKDPLSPGALEEERCSCIFAYCKFHNLNLHFLYF